MRDIVFEGVLATIRRYGMLAAEQRVGVAVSGGADSVCLLHILVDLARGWNLKLHVFHVDHRLRGEESTRDAMFVAGLAASLGLPFECFERDVAAVCGNLEQMGRNARYDSFRERLASGVVDRIALGHTQSDQAETVLFRFLRGSGTAGLAGVRPMTSEGFIRPLIGTNRTDVETWLRERRLPWREDATNADCRFARNRIRHEWLPALTREWNPALPATLARLADWAFEEENYWKIEIDRLEPEILVRRASAIIVNVLPLRQLPIAASRRLLRRAVDMAKGDLRSVDFSHIEEIRAIAVAPAAHARVQVPGLDVIRSFDWVCFAPRHCRKDGEFTYRLRVPGSFSLPHRASVIALLLAECESIYNDSVDCLDWDRLSGSLEMRNWMAGDRYRRAGHASEEKIKTLFQQLRVPVWERRGWPVITCGNEIVWARKFGPAAEFAVSPETRNFLVIQETGESWNRDVSA